MSLHHDEPHDLRPPPLLLYRELPFAQDLTRPLETDPVPQVLSRARPPLLPLAVSKVEPPPPCRADLGSGDEADGSDGLAAEQDSAAPVLEGSMEVSVEDLLRALQREVSPRGPAAPDELTVVPPLLQRPTALHASRGLERQVPELVQHPAPHPLVRLVLRPHHSLQPGVFFHPAMAQSEEEQEQLRRRERGKGGRGRHVQEPLFCFQ
eukprot:767201-Hanusia_phi.AAC.3